MSTLPTPPTGCSQDGSAGYGDEGARVIRPHKQTLGGARQTNAPEVDSVALSTTAIRLLNGLTTRVRSFFGVKTIMPASGSAPESETPPRGQDVLGGVYNMRAGITPELLTWRGFETKARNFRPLCVCVRFE